MKLSGAPEPDQLLSATEFIDQVNTLTFDEREEAALTTLLQGHVPSYMRSFVKLTVTFRDKQNVTHELSLHVLPDYLTIGNDLDHLLMPLNPLTAQKLCDAWNCMLPTSKIVNMIWSSAAFKLSPQPWGPPYDASMHSTSRYVVHNERIMATMQKNLVDHTKLVAGHKKDVVLCNRLALQPKQVAIYGWHQANGIPIQPVSLVHENTYADYSHGIRLVSLECELDGNAEDLRAVLQDPTLCIAVSNEGPLKVIRQP